MKESFADIVNSESQRLYGLCFRLTGNSQEAEDLCQHALARALPANERRKEDGTITFNYSLG